MFHCTWSAPIFFFVSVSYFHGWEQHTSFCDILVLDIGLLRCIGDTEMSSYFWYKFIRRLVSISTPSTHLQPHGNAFGEFVKCNETPPGHPTLSTKWTQIAVNHTGYIITLLRITIWAGMIALEFCRWQEEWYILLILLAIESGHYLLNSPLPHTFVA